MKGREYWNDDDGLLLLLLDCLLLLVSVCYSLFEFGKDREKKKGLVSDNVEGYCNKT